MKRQIRKLNGTRSAAVQAKPLRHVVAALILRGEGQQREVLICQRRADQPMGHKWEFPGGKIEPGETPEEALARELNEELAIDAKIGEKLTTVRHNYRNGAAIEIQFFIVTEFTSDLVNRIFQDMVWCTFDRLPAYDFLTADLALIQDLADGKLL
ncbi:MAG: (deoxy)nucleoside triphosphate pyrophosphohydrolase [Acidobacteriaceae bacterium]|nr:(deoxy)nucleoside triphosphate pyrophosphohydrolase [Acidobacteriaceae bacterium]